MGDTQWSLGYAPQRNSTSRAYQLATIMGCLAEQAREHRERDVERVARDVQQRGVRKQPDH
jgi:hypothetical protein